MKKYLIPLALFALCAGCAADKGVQPIAEGVNKGLTAADDVIVEAGDAVIDTVEEAAGQKPYRPDAAERERADRMASLCDTSGTQILGWRRMGLSWSEIALKCGVSENQEAVWIVWDAGEGKKE